MFNFDYQIIKDFDINNLFLNLTFHKQTEEFEFREPLLDHPSNYQMIVTKFFLKVYFPFIQLHESKKNSQLLLQQGEDYLYDYYIHVYFERKGNTFEGKDSVEAFEHRQNLYMIVPQTLDEGNFEPELRTKVVEDYDDIPNDEDIDANEEYNLETGKAKQLYWFKSDALNAIYSPQELLVILNNALDAAIDRFVTTVQDAEEADPDFAEVADFLDDKPVMFFVYKKDHPSLFVIKHIIYMKCRVSVAIH